MFIPLSPDLSDILKGFMVLIKEILRKLAHVLAVLKLGCCDLRSVLKVTILVKNFMNLVFDFGLQVEIFK